VVELKRQIAERSLEWRDADKVSFIWGEELVIAYVNRDYNTWYALTDLTIKDMRDINKWLGTYLQTLKEAEEDDAQETGQKVPPVRKRNRS